MDFQGRQEMSVVGPECRLPRDSITPEIDGKAEAWAALSSTPWLQLAVTFLRNALLLLLNCHRHPNEFREIACAKSLHDPCAMVLDSFCTYSQPSCDFLAR